MRHPSQRQRNVSAHRRVSQRGHYMLETALAILPLLALALAIVDFAVPIFLRAVFTNAVREGVRYAITYQTASGKTHANSIKDVVQQNAMGFLDGGQGQQKISVKFYSPVTFAEVTGGNANADGNIVEVSIRGYSWGWILPLWRSGNPLTINAASADRLETLPRSSARPAP